MKECKILVMFSLFDNQLDMYIFLEHNDFGMSCHFKESIIDHLFLFSFIYFHSEFSDVERCVEICTGVWIRDFLAHLLLLHQRPKLQVTHFSIFTSTDTLKLPESTSVDKKKMRQQLPNLLCQISEFCSTITAASYAGLIYLGLRFLRKSILNR